MCHAEETSMLNNHDHDLDLNLQSFDHQQRWLYYFIEENFPESKKKQQKNKTYNRLFCFHEILFHHQRRKIK